MNEVDQRFSEILESMNDNNQEFDFYFLTHSINMFLEDNEDDKIRYSELLLLTAYKYLEIYDSDNELFEPLYLEGLSILENLDDVIEDTLSSLKSTRMSIYRNIIKATKLELFIKYDEYISTCLESVLEFDFDQEIMEMLKEHLEKMAHDGNDYNERVMDTIAYCMNSIKEDQTELHLEIDEGFLTIHQIMSYCAGKMAAKKYDDAIVCLDKYLQDSRFEKEEIAQLLKVQYELFEIEDRVLDALEVGARLFVLGHVEYYQKMNQLFDDEMEINSQIKNAFLDEERFKDEQLLEKYLYFIESIDDDDALIDYLMEDPLKIVHHIHNIEPERLSQIVEILERAIELECEKGECFAGSYIDLYRDYCGNALTDELIGQMRLKYKL